MEIKDDKDSMKEFSLYFKLNKKNTKVDIQEFQDEYTKFKLSKQTGNEN